MQITVFPILRDSGDAFKITASKLFWKRLGLPYTVGTHPWSLCQGNRATPCEGLPYPRSLRLPALLWFASYSQFAFKSNKNARGYCGDTCLETSLSQSFSCKMLCVKSKGKINTKSKLVVPCGEKEQWVEGHGEGYWGLCPGDALVLQFHDG